jgi:hypothetical protein
MRMHILSGVVVGLLVIGGCDSKAPPASATQPQSGGALGGLRENPTSIPGKSAAMGRDVARAAAGAQDQASNLANDISGGGINVGGLKFTAPDSWTQTQPANRMQAAALRVDNDTTVAFFGNIGGDVDSNINRWRTQMSDGSGKPVDAKITTDSAAGMKVTFVSMEGTYKGMSGGADDSPKANTGFRGAILAGNDGKPVAFVRLTGPVSKVKSVEAEFRQMVLGASK